MAEDIRYDDDYEDDEDEDQSNSPGDDDILNEAERWKSVGNKHMASMVRTPNTRFWIPSWTDSSVQ